MATNESPIREIMRPSTSVFNLLIGGSGASLLTALYVLEPRSMRLNGSGRSAAAIAGCVLILFAMRGIILDWLFGKQRRTAPGRTREIVRLPREGLVYLVIMVVMALGSLLGRDNLLMLVFAMMAGPYVVNGWIVSAMLKKVRVERSVPPRAIAGEPVPIEISLANNKRVFSSRLMAVQDRVYNSDEVLEPAVLFLRVPPRERRRATYVVHLMRRGEYKFGPFYTSSRFPLGLGERGRLEHAGDRILVHPTIGRISSGWKTATLTGSELVQQQRGATGPFDDEFHRIREYRQGDNPRAIHWRTSARMNELMIREFEQSRDHHLVILLDLFQQDRTMENRANLEMAISFAATLSVEHVRDTREARLGIALSSDTITDIEGPARASTLEAILDALALAKGSRKSNLGALIREAAKVESGGSRVVLITPRRAEAIHQIDEVIRETQSGRAIERTSEIRVISSRTEDLADTISFPGAESPAETTGTLALEVTA